MKDKRHWLFIFFIFALILWTVTEPTQAKEGQKTRSSISEKREYSSLTKESANIPKSRKDAERLFLCFARERGMDDVHIAAILGVYSKESGMDPTTVETITDAPFRINEEKRRAEEAGFDLKQIDRNYADRFPAIERAGIGFGAWTDTRDMQEGMGAHTLLLKFAQEHGFKWYDMTAQLYFWYDGVPENLELGYRNWHGRNAFESAQTIREAAEEFMCKRVAGWNVSKTAAYSRLMLEERVQNAKKYYEKIINGYYGV